MLENTQFVLVAAVHKLYSMVLNQQPWDLGEIELNDRGQPVVHNIASKLGCIRPNTDTDLPSVFPEDEAGLAELARQLEEQQQKDMDAGMDKTGTANSPSTVTRKKNASKNPAPIITNTNSYTSSQALDRACSSSVASLDLSDFEQIDDYRKAAFGGATTNSSAVTLSPASLSYTDFEFPHQSTTTQQSPSDGGFHSPIAPPNPHPLAQQQYSSTYAWVSQSQQQQQQQQAQYGFLDAADVVMQQQQQQQQQQLMESAHFDAAMKPHLLAAAQNHHHHPGVMMGLGDPMIYPGYDAEVLGL